MPDARRDAVPIALGYRRVANGGWEWFLEVGGIPVYPPGSTVGVFTGADVTAHHAFGLVMAQWRERA